ncbi:MAG TPA: hypothetical protein VFN22_13045 [Gemmatimonadales bacterium]|nr:hypothetical protein [Gemmatimonadales bacterium]
MAFSLGSRAGVAVLLSARQIFMTASSIAVVTVLIGTCSLVSAQSGSLSELYRISGDEHQFSANHDALVLDARSVAVIDRSERSIKLFLGTQLVRTIGRAGEGPGEFRHLSRLLLSGDELWAYDVTLRRATRFDDRGGVAESFQLPADVSATGGRLGPPYLLGFAGGRELVLSLGPPRSGAWPVWAGEPGRQTLIVRGSRTGSFSEVLAAVNGAETCTVMVRTSRAMTLLKVPLCRSSIWSIDDVGNRLAVVEEAVGGSGRGRLRVISIATTGDTLWRRELPFQAIPLPASVRDSIEKVLTRRIEGVAGGKRSGVDINMPSSYPGATEVLLSQSGEVWVRGFPGDGQVNWWVISSDGQRVRTMILSDRLMVRSIRGTTLAGVLEDEYDVPDIVVYRVVD